MVLQFRLLICLAAFFELTGCAVRLPAHSAAADDTQKPSSPWAAASSSKSTGAWEDFTFPGKQTSKFSYVREDGRDAMSAHAQSSVSMWRQVVRVEPAELGRIKFSWKVPQLIARADMATREMDDSPVRIVLAFDGDRAKFSAKNAMLSELARALTGEEMPYATMMYVWCNACNRESVIVNPRTDRVRKLVLESGPGNLNRWMDYERVIREDFEKLFGESPGALISVALMTDTDNTKSIANAWYGPVNLVPDSTTRSPPPR